MDDRQQENRTEGDDRLVTLGRVSGLFGVRGWVKVYSDTDPRENIVRYSPWFLKKKGQQWQEWKLEKGQRQGKHVVAKLAGIDDRDAAAELMGALIAVRRSQFSGANEPGEYYWTDLEGLSVTTDKGVELGRVVRLFETGSNDVLVVKGERERLIPYLWQQVVLEVDLEAGTMVVDWDPEF
jgi:16S rRNA processing protein RimM